MDGRHLHLVCNWILPTRKKPQVKPKICPPNVALEEKGKSRTEGESEVCSVRAKSYPQKSSVGSRQYLERIHSFNS